MGERVAMNVRLEREELRSLRRLAVDQGVSMSNLFRKMVSDFLSRARPMSDKEWKSDPFFAIGSRPARSGLKDLGLNHDKYLYPRGKGRA